MPRHYTPRQPPVSLICLYCARPFIVAAHKARRGHPFCGTACVVADQRRGQVPRTCQVCARTFTVIQSRAARDEGRFCSHACRRVDFTATRPARFWARVDKTTTPDGCWVWTGCCDRRGYGYTGMRYEARAAHRIAYILTYGSIPDGLFVLHACDNPPCCRPEHLHLGTDADNRREASERGRLRRGETHPAARLTEDAVRAIRRSYADGAAYGDLARAFGVSAGAVLDVVRRRRWKHVD